MCLLRQLVQISVQILNLYTLQKSEIVENLVDN